MIWFEVLAIGAVVGFLGGLFGKGGSAIATPMLAAVGIPPIIAVAAPLPATIPGTMAGARPYLRGDHFDRTVLTWSLLAGVICTIVGALLTNWIEPRALVVATDFIVALLGLKFLVSPSHNPEAEDVNVTHRMARTIAVGAVVGLAAGLLANSGGFLLAPLYIAVLRMPVKAAFGTSLVVACILAVPGTLVHAAMGHIDWAVVACFAVASVPLSATGARLALRTNPARLERVYGAVLVVFGVGFLALQ